MAATITIYGKGGSSHEVVPEASSVRKMELMKEDYIRLVFTSKYKININLGDYITHETWGTFYITKPQKGVYNKSTGGYDYDIQFDAPYYKWNNKLYKFEPGTKRNEASWSLTDKLENHMAVFLRNLTHHGWNYTVDPLSYQVDGVDKAVFIQFDNKYILDALTQIAEAFNVEWWITDTVIHFGKAEHGTAVPFEVGINVEEMSAEKSSGDYISRLYAFGAARNLPPDYRKNDEQVLLNGVVQKRVMMPELTPYVDIENGLTDDEIVEGIVLFDDVYPRTESAITQVTEIVKPIETNDSTTEATTDEVDENDEEQETATFYRFKKNGFLFSKDYILAGQTLQIQFTSGPLNGMTFDLVFNPDGLPEKTYTHGDQDERVEIDNPDAQVFEIVRNDTYGLFLPNETLKPQVSNTFVLLGWDITKVEDGLGLVTAAENELYQRAQDYAARLKKDPLTYPCTMMADYMYGLTGGGQQDPNYSKVGTFELGQRIQLVSDAYFDGGVRVSRVVGFEYKLDKPYDGAVIYVGESATYSGKKDSQAKLNEAVNSINYRNSEYGSTGAGGSFYVIGTNDTTTPGDSNVYSALRSDRQYARKNKNDVIGSLWTFKHGNGLRRGLQTQEYNGVGSNEDNLFGKGFELISKTNAQGDVRTRLEVDELFVRIKAFFAKLEIREISYVGGNYCFSAAGSRIYYVDWIDASGNVIDKTIGSIADVYKFRCYLYSDDGTTATINKWAIDDQVMCRTFNIDSGVHQNVSNKYYWRRVTGVGRGVIPSQVVTPEYSDDEVPTPTEYQYVDISMADCATGSDYPEAEDAIVQFGNWSNSARQGVIYLMVEGESAPAIMEYSGVGANGQHFVLPDPTLLLSPTKNVIYGEFHSVVDSGGSTGGGDTIDDQIQALIDALNNIKNQADKKMEIWFGAYVPLPNSDNQNATANYPASEWATDELKALHAQDIYFNTDRVPASQGGRAWRWIAVETNDVVSYQWSEILDADTIASLEKIADVASDGKLTGGAEKTRVFLDWQKAVQEYWEYKDRAEDYGITTEWTAYNTAFLALGAMLNDGEALGQNQDLSWQTPAWLQNLQTDTTIASPSTYRTTWGNYYAAATVFSQITSKLAKDIADETKADLVLVSLINLVYGYSGGYIRNKTSNQYLCLYLGSQTGTPNAEGDMCYYSVQGETEWTLKRYENSAWVTITNDLLQRAFKAMYAITGNATLRVFRTKPSITPNLYDTICSQVTFTDTNLEVGNPYREVEGGICISMWNGSYWVVLQESERSILENLPGYVRMVAFGSANGTITSAGIVTESNYVNMFATATDNNGKTISQAYLSTFIEKVSDGAGGYKIQSGVSIGADQVVFTGKTIDLSADQIAFTGKTVINGKFTVDNNGNVIMTNMTANKATIQNSELTNVKVNGIIASPFVVENSEITWIDGEEYYAAKAHDNLLYNSSNHHLYWNAECSGRLITLCHHESVTGSTTFTAPSGMYFYEDGRKRSSIEVSRQCVILKGYGTASTFLGYIVVRRIDLSPTRSYGRELKCLGFGTIVYGNSAVTLSYKTFDGKTLTASRTGEGEYELSIPSDWNIEAGELLAMATALGNIAEGSNPLYAGVKGYTNTNGVVTGVTLQCGDDVSRNDGNIQFMLFNIGDFDQI